ncbi:hypothetical protein [Nonomuraea recticatena]|uniref:hypothetical protein n=1 Tax=Nonomuraea recticatena TaxID=46178 RepID=UPI003617E1C1
MSQRATLWMWVGLVAAAAVAGGLGVLLFTMDLDEADQLASVIGMFIGLAGLGVSIYGLVRGRSEDAAAPPDRAGARWWYRVLRRVGKGSLRAESE